MTAVDRTPKPCNHPVADHRHGTYACYVADGCRCYPCAAAQSEYERNRVRQHAYGRWDNLVDAAPAREHVRALMAAGVGWKRVAQHAGLHASAVGNLLYGRPGYAPSRRIRKQTAAALLAVPIDAAVAGGQNVPAVGTHRRLQALVACGWSQSKLAVELGMLRSNFTALMNRDAVSASTADTVVALYERLWNVPPPADDHRSKISVNRSRNLARAKGWHPPMAWDDDTLDDPTAQPAVVELDAHRAHGNRKLPPADELQWLVDIGESIAVIALRYGVSEDGVSRALGRTPAA